MTFASNSSWWCKRCIACLSSIERLRVNMVRAVEPVPNEREWFQCTVELDLTSDVDFPIVQAVCHYYGIKIVPES